MEQHRRMIQSAIARMTEVELETVWIPGEFVVNTPRHPKNYISRREGLVAWLQSIIARMSTGQLLQLHIPAHLMV